MNLPRSHHCGDREYKALLKPLFVDCLKEFFELGLRKKRRPAGRNLEMLHSSTGILLQKVPVDSLLEEGFHVSEINVDLAGGNLFQPESLEALNVKMGVGSKIPVTKQPVEGLEDSWIEGDEGGGNWFPRTEGKPRQIRMPRSL